jgi:hypothetical protein
MREYPNPDYSVKISKLTSQEQPGVARFLDGGWSLSVNHCTLINIVSYLPASPWPLAPAEDLDTAADRDEAARVVLSTSMLLIAPTDNIERIEELTGDVPDKQTIFWFSRSRYIALDAELLALHQRPYQRGDDHQLRLSHLSDGPLRTFLTYDLPRAAALSDYDRKILCLGPLHQYL